MAFSLFKPPNKMIAEEKRKIEEFESKISEKLDVAMQKDFEIDQLRGEKQRAIEGLQKDNSVLKARIKELETQIFEERKKKHQDIQMISEERTKISDHLKILEDEKYGLSEKLAEVQKMHEE